MAEFVLLGVSDAATGSKNTSWRTNKIGGKADWIGEDLGSPLCIQCKKALSFVVQVYCPLDNSKFHRSLYVFCCCNKDCWISSKGWRIYRAQRSQVDHKLLSNKSKASNTQVFDSWGDDDDDWGDGGDDIEGLESAGFDTKVTKPVDFSATTDKLQSLLLADRETTSSSFSDAEPSHVFNSCYINVFDEADCAKAEDNDEHIQDMISEYNKHDQIDSGSSCNLNVTANELYEKDDVKDRSFHKFWKKVNLFPSQVIRYSWNGTPLLFSDKPESSSIPKCQNCGAERIFEFQLMPALIPHLKLNEKGDEQIEFGSVLFYTCSESCWNEEVHEEHVEYLPDPDLKYFKTQPLKR